jgi:hypothetical protein
MAAVSITPSLQSICSRAIATPDLLNEEETIRLNDEMSGGYVSHSTLWALKRNFDKLGEKESLQEILRGSKVTIPAFQKKDVEVGNSSSVYISDCKEDQQSVS